MPDYKQGKIYKLEGGGKFYYGSTIQSLPQRRGDHCSDATTRRQKTKVYAFFNSIGWENVSISLVETYPCSTKQELLSQSILRMRIVWTKRGVLLQMLTRRPRRLHGIEVKRDKKPQKPTKNTIRWKFNVIVEWWWAMVVWPSTKNGQYTWISPGPKAHEMLGK